MRNGGRARAWSSQVLPDSTDRPPARFRTVVHVELRCLRLPQLLLLGDSAEDLLARRSGLDWNRRPTIAMTLTCTNARPQNSRQFGASRCEIQDRPQHKGAKITTEREIMTELVLMVAWECNEKAAANNPMSKHRTAIQRLPQLIGELALRQGSSEPWTNGRRCGSSASIDSAKRTAFARDPFNPRRSRGSSGAFRRPPW